MTCRWYFPLCLFLMLGLTGCATTPTAKLHYTIRDDPGSRPVQHVVLLPVDVDVYEMSAGGVKEEVPEWSRSAESNVRSALLVSPDRRGECCVTEVVDSASLTREERDALEEHLALFNVVAANALWTGLPGNSAWKFKSEHFDYTLGDGLGFLKTKYDIDAGLIILGEDVVSTGGRKALHVLGAVSGVYIPMGHSLLFGGLVDFETGDLLWMNHEIAAGGTEDLRDPESCLDLAGKLMEGYPGLEADTGGSASPGD